MPSLAYANLGAERPDRLEEATRDALAPFSGFLSDAAARVRRIRVVVAWVEVGEASRPATDGSQIWVRLVPPPGGADLTDEAYDAFFDDECRHVEDCGGPGAGDGAGAPSDVRPRRVPRIEVVDRRRDDNWLLLERRPATDRLSPRANTYVLDRQREAVEGLRHSPFPEHRPLLRLFEPRAEAAWPEVGADTFGVEWKFLTDAARPGIDDQRRFVRLALATPDFAFLEGPPGSGKTTAICELVAQLAARGKRVLLCASTHVAVDNVLERLFTPAGAGGRDVIAVRIGDRANVSERARPFCLAEWTARERDRLRDGLARRRRTESQSVMYDVVNSADRGLERLVLDASNLVCGTTIGILQHPAIKQQAHGTPVAPSFDALILDEASKTTFSEFLVSARLARRWLVVGDVRQLSPYVETEAVATAISEFAPSPVVQDACFDVLHALPDDQGRRKTTLVVVDDPESILSDYRGQAGDRVVVLGHEDEDLPAADIAIVPPGFDARAADRVPLDVARIRGTVSSATARRAAVRAPAGEPLVEPSAWSEEVAWRLVRSFEHRRSGGPSREKLERELHALLPFGSAEARRRLSEVRRVALCSLLESLQLGGALPEEEAPDTALVRGLPVATREARSVLLRFQHRMHPHVSEVPRDLVYDGEALRDPPDMARARAWSISMYERRSAWVHVDGRFSADVEANDEEVERVVLEVDRFATAVRGSTRTRDEPWSVAVLCFYRGQERRLRAVLRDRLKQPDAHAHFTVPSGDGSPVSLSLATVDRFQGQEADVVLLTVANHHWTNYLESLNRWNVALTRARFALRVFVNRRGLERSRSPWIQRLRERIRWEHDLGAPE